MEPWLDNLADDLQSMSFNSTTIATEINRSTSSSSEMTWTAASSSTGHLGPAPIPITTTTTTKPHTPSSDPYWDAICSARSDSPFGQIALSDLQFLHHLGAGDIGSVYLAELKCAANSDELFVAKVMNKKELASRNKNGQARTEREILEMLDHLFLPTLYATLESPKWSCLLTKFCLGGDLHILRQRQPCKRFPESAVRCAR